MRLITPLFLIVLISILTVNASEEFKSETGRFSVTLPDKPAESTKSVDTDAGKIELHIFLVAQRDKTASVIYSDYPKGFLEKTDVQSLLDGGRDGFVENVKGELMKETKIFMGGTPAREIEVKVTHGTGIYIYRVRLLMKKNRLYQLVTSSNPDDADAATSFFKSFKLIETK